MIPLFVVDAFTRRAFAGNPAGVCLLDSPREADWMQAVAAEMRHSETAFLVPEGEAWRLRWFTPTVEVDLCGHATLASAHVLFSTGRAAESVTFRTGSGELVCQRSDGGIAMDFPAEPIAEAALGEDDWLVAKVSKTLGAGFVGRNRMDWLFELPDEPTVRALEPDFAAIRSLGMRGLIVTARSDRPEFDFVSRFFAPQSGVDEDPVTGSAHCALGPFWAERLERTALLGAQLSARGGAVGVQVRGDRVTLTGHAVTVVAGELLA